MSDRIPQLINARKLTDAWVASTMAHDIATNYLNDSAEKGSLEPLVKVLAVTRDLLDELLSEAFPDAELDSLPLEAESEMVM